MQRPRQLARSAAAAAAKLLSRYARGLVATAALAAITTGLWMERPSLGLIVPGAIVFAALAWSHVRGVNHDA